MNLELFLTFVLATIVMIVIPGPSVLLTVAHAMAFGTRRALVTLAGIVSGISVQLVVTLIGMTSFMLFLAAWFELLRWAGVAYLVYLGLQQWLSKPDAAAPATDVGRSRRSLFAQGFLVTVTNPKSMVFLAAFFPQFVDPGAPLVPQLAAMSLAFVAIAYVFTGLWCLPAARLGHWLSGQRRLIWRNRITGSLFLGAGLGLALARRS
jgi:threonine/homoserine/homoserine lactone efflux protein